MRRQKLNKISAWVLGLAILLLSHVPNVSAQIQQSPSDQTVARFLYQTSFGPTPALINEVRENGLEDWIQKQINLPATYHQPLYQTPFSKGLQSNRENAWYQIVVTAEDQLRQRTAYALSQIVVVSRYGGVLSSKPTGLVNYYDLLVEHAFGNYRDLLYDVSIHPVMGSYLSMLGSAKENSATGTLPDENFARELMQLFTIGLYELNLDGSKKLNHETGKPIPTYNQTDIQELARASTGWKNSDIAFVKPMRVISQRHDTGEKRFLGNVIPSGLTAQEELSKVIDMLMSHPNVAPFVSKLLIQRLVSSNPSPEYVARVATIFNNNGEGEKGDLTAVVRAILLDPEALGMTDTPPIKVKEPILVLTNFHRASGFTIKGSRYEDATTMMNIANQGPLRSPSVFNFYSPDYQPSNEFTESGINSPEYELLNWSVYTDLVNYMLTSTRRGGGDSYHFDLNEFYLLLDDHRALVELVNERFFAGTASAELKELMLTALNDYRGDYVPTTKLALVIFTAISGDEFYIQD
ncbi:TPA: DUF1800 domain-containing protein [Vibrio alginolyticus]|nr:DUF1800 domain-containing protein [Vibrio alginolyticus]HBC3521952.1 DUF1800 domain-containing protein [Vibrio alginolyticus]